MHGLGLPIARSVGPGRRRCRWIPLWLYLVVLHFFSGDALTTALRRDAWSDGDQQERFSIAVTSVWRSDVAAVHPCTL
jgi:hypothetical protein